MAKATVKVRTVKTRTKARVHKSSSGASKGCKRCPTYGRFLWGWIMHDKRTRKKLKEDQVVSVEEFNKTVDELKKEILYIL